MQQSTDTPESPSTSSQSQYPSKQPNNGTKPNFNPAISSAVSRSEHRRQVKESERKRKSEKQERDNAAIAAANEAAARESQRRKDIEIGINFLKTGEVNGLPENASPKEQLLALGKLYDTLDKQKDEKSGYIFKSSIFDSYINSLRNKITVRSTKEETEAIKAQIKEAQDRKEALEDYISDTNSKVDRLKSYADKVSQGAEDDDRAWAAGAAKKDKRERDAARRLRLKPYADKVSQGAEDDDRAWAAGAAKKDKRERDAAKRLRLKSYADKVSQGAEDDDRAWAAGAAKKDKRERDIAADKRLKQQQDLQSQIDAVTDTLNEKDAEKIRASSVSSKNDNLQPQQQKQSPPKKNEPKQQPSKQQPPQQQQNTGGGSGGQGGKTGSEETKQSFLSKYFGANCPDRLRNVSAAALGTALLAYGGYKLYKKWQEYKKKKEVNNNAK